MSNSKTIPARRRKLVTMAQMAVLIAIIIILDMTNLGYPQFGVVAITVMMIPVAIGAIVCGPYTGAFLGLIFGLTSLRRAMTSDAFGLLLFGINPILTAVLCVVPRTLVGLLSGFIFRAVAKADKSKIVPFAAATISSAVLNTLFFLGGLMIFFWSSDTFITSMSAFGMPVSSPVTLMLALAGVNAVIEIVACSVVGFAVSKALVTFIPSFDSVPKPEKA